MASTKVHQAPPPLRTNILSANFPDEIARHILSFHAATNVRAALPQADQWTVLASFFTFEASEGDRGSKGDGSVELLTMATGVKCLGGAQRNRDVVLVDMHAEILARRELELLIMEDISDLTQNIPKTASSEAGPVRGIIERYDNQSIPAFRKRPRLQLFLYTSHAPCGPASSAAHLARLQAEDDYIAACVRLITQDIPESSNGPAVMSTFRLGKLDPNPPPAKKPSRGDAAPTSAYTCSDKLSRYQVLGMQGGRLAGLLGGAEATDHAIRLDGIIIGEDFDEKGLQMLFGGVKPDEQQVHSRLGEGLNEIIGAEDHSAGLEYLEPLRNRPFRIWTTAERFKHGRAATLARHGDPLSRPPVPIPDDIDPNTPLPFMREVLLPPTPIAPFSIASSWHRNVTVQVIGPSGQLAGVSKKQVEKAGEDARWSRLCRKRMWEEFRELQRSLGVQETGKGGEGWNVVRGWMEARGPYKGWHRAAEPEGKAKESSR